MLLEELKNSIKSMSDEELFELLRIIRQDRATPAIKTKSRKATSVNNTSTSRVTMNTLLNGIDAQAAKELLAKLTGG